MLRIKDNIDLKKLEKFGFKAVTIVKTTKYQYCGIINNREIMNVKIGENNIIHLNQLSINNTALDILYDLIKADMVEKVEIYDK